MEKNLVLTEIKDVDLSKLEDDSFYHTMKYKTPCCHLGKFIKDEDCNLGITHVLLPPSSNSLQGMREPDGWVVNDSDFYNNYPSGSAKESIKPVYFAPFLSQPIESTNKATEGEIEKIGEQIYADYIDSVEDDERSYTDIAIIGIRKGLSLQLDNKKQVEDWDEVEKEWKKTENLGKYVFAFLKANYSLPIVDIGEKG